MKCRFIHIGLFAVALMAGPVGAGELYRSVDANGAVVFTDVPPPEAITVAQVSTDSAKQVAVQYNMLPTDEAVAQANARVDLAEHNFALARRPIAVNALGFHTDRRSASERARVEFYKRDLQVAHGNLAALLRQRAVPAY